MPPYFRQQFYIINLWSNDSTNVRPQLIYSHSLECTKVPRESLTLMVISPALVNGLPHWPVIKWFLPCSTPRHPFTWSDSYHIGIGMKTLGWAITLIYASPRLRRSSIEQWHIHYYIDPLCIGRGYVLSSRRSTVYSSWLRSVHVIRV